MDIFNLIIEEFKNANVIHIITMFIVILLYAFYPFISIITKEIFKKYI
ncbi:hypothetical protein [Macrococcoides canis]|nr:hypothetical protein [Macrococcus canis]WBF54040.1 hypothetical protein LL975_12110 [Macrococcus canis]